MSNGKVTVLSGLSGAGKSTYARELLGDVRPPPAIGTKCVTFHQKGVVVSADTFFMKDGIYQFDPSLLGDAHARCFRDFILCLIDGYGQVIVDNTCTTNEEIAPYILGATAFKYEAEIITLKCSMAMALARNVHGVGERAIEAQWVRLNNRQLLPWWKNTDIIVPDPEENVYGCPGCEARR